MASLSEIRDAVKATLESNVQGLTAYDTVPDASNLPAVVVMLDTTDFMQAMGRGLDTYEFDLHVLVSTNDMGLRQDELDAYVTGAGTKSIREAIFRNRKLGRNDVDAHVSGLTAYNEKFTMSNIQHIGATLHLVVHTIGTA